jgi:SAM-dependent methyltransferase
MSDRPADWVLDVTRRSVPKQAKIRELARAIGSVRQEACLDVGGDNGAVSAALRRLGGRWASADLDERSVRSIREVVGGDVRVITGGALPFDAQSFDLVVIADLLEHLEDDRAFVRDCARVLRPGGTLVVNVPHVKRRSIINAMRHGIGLTDEWHGHVRPGYSLDGLRGLLEPDFVLEAARTYSRAFSESVDLLMNGAFRILNPSGAREGRSPKGTVVTGADVKRHGRAFGLLGVAFPFLWAFSRLDALLPLQPGYKLIVRARLDRRAEGAAA